MGTRVNNDRVETVSDNGITIKNYYQTISGREKLIKQERYDTNGVLQGYTDYKLSHGKTINKFVYTRNDDGTYSRFNKQAERKKSQPKTAYLSEKQIRDYQKQGGERPKPIPVSQSVNDGTLGITSPSYRIEYLSTGGVRVYNQQGEVVSFKEARKYLTQDQIEQIGQGQKQTYLEQQRFNAVIAKSNAARDRAESILSANKRGFVSSEGSSSINSAVAYGSVVAQAKRFNIKQDKVDSIIQTFKPLNYMTVVPQDDTVSYGSVIGFGGGSSGFRGEERIGLKDKWKSVFNQKIDESIIMQQNYLREAEKYKEYAESKLVSNDLGYGIYTEPRPKGFGNTVVYLGAKYLQRSSEVMAYFQEGERSQVRELRDKPYLTAASFYTSYLGATGKVLKLPFISKEISFGAGAKYLGAANFAFLKPTRESIAISTFDRSSAFFSSSINNLKDESKNRPYNYMSNNSAEFHNLNKAGTYIKNLSKETGYRIGGIFSGIGAYTVRNPLKSYATLKGFQAASVYSSQPINNVFTRTFPFAVLGGYETASAPKGERLSTGLAYGLLAYSPEILPKLKPYYYKAKVKLGFANKADYLGQSLEVHKGKGDTYILGSEKGYQKITYGKQNRIYFVKRVAKPSIKSPSTYVDFLTGKKAGQFKTWKPYNENILLRDTPSQFGIAQDILKASGKQSLLLRSTPDSSYLNGNYQVLPMGSLAQPRVRVGGLETGYFWATESTRDTSIIGGRTFGPGQKQAYIYYGRSSDARFSDVLRGEAKFSLFGSKPAIEISRQYVEKIPQKYVDLLNKQGGKLTYEQYTEYSRETGKQPGKTFGGAAALGGVRTELEVIDAPFTSRKVVSKQKDVVLSNTGEAFDVFYTKKVKLNKQQTIDVLKQSVEYSKERISDLNKIDKPFASSAVQREIQTIKDLNKQISGLESGTLKLDKVRYTEQKFTPQELEAIKSTPSYDRQVSSSIARPTYSPNYSAAISSSSRIYVPSSKSVSSISSVSSSSSPIPSVASTSSIPSSNISGKSSSQVFSSRVSGSSSYKPSSSSSSSFSGSSSYRGSGIAQIPRTSIPKIPSIKPRRAETSGSFSVQIRRGGKFRTVGTGLSYEKAIARGQRGVENTAAASFRLLKNNKIAKIKQINNGRYRTSTKEKGVIIEKNRFRISTSGEKAQITAKGIAANKYTKRSRI